HMVMQGLYFGTDANEVANAAGAAPQMGTTFDPGQLENDTAYYHHYKSADGNSNFVYINIKNKISGYCIYESDFVPFTGILNNNKFILRRRWSENIVFDGTLLDGKILGKLFSESEITGKDIKFYKQERHYILPLHQYAMYKEIPLIADVPSSPTGKLFLTTILPDNKYRHAKKLKNKIFEFFLDDSTSSHITIKEIFDLTLKQFKRHYIKVNKSLYQDFSGQCVSCNWIKQKNVDVIYNDERFLCMSLNKYAFTGGAHGIMISDFLNFDLVNGEILSCNKLFTKENKKIVSKLLETELRKKYNISDSQSITEFGFFSDKIQPTSNIYITSLGIGFVYNVYELAPFSFGTIELFLKKEQIEELLNNNFY
ncbi:MAG: DUF3298 domain-containing protein, partial [Bacteroidota bacterium]|nr:DUF3298 domain-containing protein [Bacteroidota bacterium]